MLSGAWWALHALEAGLLILALGTALRSARRLGPHTAYGFQLLIVGVGFLLVLTSNLLFVTQTAILGYQSTTGGTLSDLVSLAGWMCLVFAFALFAMRADNAWAHGRNRAVVWALVLGIPTVAMSLVWLLINRGQPIGVASGFRWAFLVTDGVGATLLMLSVQRLRQLRRAGIGLLYALLGLALCFNTAADVVYAASFTSNAWTPVVSWLYSLAGAIAVVALVLHDRWLARETPQALFVDPATSSYLRVLRDLAIAMRDEIGPMGASITLAAAAQSLAARGVANRLEEGFLEAEATEEQWNAILADVCGRIERAIGIDPRPHLGRISRAYASSPGTYRATEAAIA
ncbi:MAG: hypothetical protein ACYDDF_09420 [Thermoplasmatota archaeon]